MCSFLEFWLSTLAVRTAAGVDAINSGRKAQRYNVFDAERLTDDLFGHESINYDPDILPMVNGERVEVKIEIEMTDIANFDAVNQAIKANFWLRMQWSDPRLVWDPEMYGGVRMLKIANTQVWVPDLTLYNSESGQFGYHDEPVVTIAHIRNTSGILAAGREKFCPGHKIGFSQ